jgi:hypothetical protein
MSIEGSLSTMPVAEILMWVGQHQKTGSLELLSKMWRGRMVFMNGALIYSSSSDPDHTLGRLLIESGLIDEEIYRGAWDVAERDKLPIARVLRDLKLVSEDEIVRMLRKKAEFEIARLLPVEGMFRFNEEDLPAMDMVPMRLDVSRALLAATQQLDENAEYHIDSSALQLDIPFVPGDNDSNATPS